MNHSDGVVFAKKTERPIITLKVEAFAHTRPKLNFYVFRMCIR